MLTSYQTPGVYVEWRDVNPQLLELGRADVAGFVGIAARGPIQSPTKIESPTQFWTTFGDALPDAFLAPAIDGFFANGGRTCWIVRAANPDGAMSAHVCVRFGDRCWTVTASNPGAWGNTIIVQARRSATGASVLVVSTPDGRQQVVDLVLADDVKRMRRERPSKPWTNLLGVDDADLPELVQDQIVSVEETPDAPPDVDVGDITETEIALRSGSDGIGDLTLEHLTGSADHAWGVAALERIDGISIVAVPDLMAFCVPPVRQPALPKHRIDCSRLVPEPVSDRSSLAAPRERLSAVREEQLVAAQQEIIASCMRRRDRVAVLDLPPIGNDDAPTYPSKLPAESWAACYHPWVVVADPMGGTGDVRAIPPSGHVAGMYARVDRRRGVHKPPGNEVLEGVCDVTQAIDDRAHAALNQAAVNAIRAIPGRDILVLGVRTLCHDVRWRYVNVRRLFAMIEETLDEQMQWLTFEPNNPQLWRDIERAVRAFLERLYRAGMLDGKTSDEAYLVQCDAETNSPADTDAGRVVCQIGIQPPFPAEFVVVRIGVTRSGIQIAERGAHDV